MALKTLHLETTVGKDGHIHLDVPCGFSEGEKVRLLLIVEPEDESAGMKAVAGQDSDEETWMRWLARHSVSDLLADPAEDIYTLDDGRPFRDEG